MSYLFVNESVGTGLYQLGSKIASAGDRETHHNNKKKYFDIYYDFEKAKPELAKCVESFIKKNNHFAAYKDQHHADMIEEMNKRHPPEWRFHPDKDYFHKQRMDERARIGGAKLGSMTIMKHIGENTIYITFDHTKIYKVFLKLTRVKLRPNEVAASAFETLELPGAKNILMKYKK